MDAYKKDLSAAYQSRHLQRVSSFDWRMIYDLPALLALLGLPPLLQKAMRLSLVSAQLLLLTSIPRLLSLILNARHT